MYMENVCTTFATSAKTMLFSCKAKQDEISCVLRWVRRLRRRESRWDVLLLAHRIQPITEGVYVVKRGKWPYACAPVCFEIVFIQILQAISNEYRFSAFWLRSKCSICSYQLNIWYVPHWGTSILNWFLNTGEMSGACSALATGWSGIAVHPESAHSPTGEKQPKQ